MKTGTGLALICVGAILAFAVTADNSVFNWTIAGWVIMLVGLFGLVIPRRGYAWVSRRLFVRQARRPGNRAATRSSIRPTSAATRPTAACRPPCPPRGRGPPRGIHPCGRGPDGIY